jgi:PilZ domain
MAILEGNNRDRRMSRRRPLHEIPEVMAVKVQSEKVQVVDASREGILIECSLRLTPGATSQLEILRVDGPLRVRGRVVRCEITGINGGKVQYRVAIAFNEQLDFISDEPAPEQPSLPAVAPAAGPVVALVEPTSTTVLQASPSAEESKVVEVSDSDSAFFLNGW